MITNINEYRQRMTTIKGSTDRLNNKSKEYSRKYVQDFIATKNLEVRGVILDYINYILSLKINKEDSINLVEKVFTDPLNAPDNINVEFVNKYKADIIQSLKNMPNEIFFKDSVELDKDMTNNPTGHFECIVYSKSNKLKMLSEKLNEKIAKDDFKCIYKNDIFYISDIDKLNENNKNIVLKILKENKVVNMIETLKIIRKINEKV